MSAPSSGPLGEGFDIHPSITAVDTGQPPRFAWIELDRESYAVLLLVRPGRGVALLFPRDSSVDNQLGTGAHQITFSVLPPKPSQDTLMRMRRRTRQARDSMRATAEQGGSAPPSVIQDTYLLLITSPQRLDYERVRARTVGVSIPVDELEALNAVAKSVKSTLVTEPREWAAYYRAITIARE